MRFALGPIALRIATRGVIGGIAAGTLGALRPVVAFGTLGAIRPFGPFTARPLLLLLLLLRWLAWRVLTLCTLVAIVVAIVAVIAIVAVRVHILVVVAVEIVVVAWAAAALLLLLILETRATFLEHAEIMIGELKIVFGLDAVPGKLRVTRHALVLFQKLRRVAALTIVARVAAAVALHSLRTLATTATTASVLLTIVDQVLIPCRTGIALATPKTHSFAKEYWNPGEQVGRTVTSAATTPPLPPSAQLALGTAIVAGVGNAALLQKGEQPRSCTPM